MEGINTAVDELFLFCIVVVSVGWFMCAEHSQCVMTVLQSYREWQQLTEEILIPRIPFAGEALCPGIVAKK